MGNLGGGKTRPPESSGGQRVITGAPGGGRHLNENTGGEEARGGERDARASKVTEDTEIGRGNLGGGEEGGGGIAINRPKYLTLKYWPESSVWVSSARGWNFTTL